MTTKTTKRNRDERGEARIDEDLLDKLLEGYEQPDDLFGHGGLFDRLKARLVERVLEGELNAHLGYGKHEPRPEGQQNARNGHTAAKRVKTRDGEMCVVAPRDRDGSFEPVLLPKGARRLNNFDNIVIALYAQGMSTRAIQTHLREIYQTEVSPELISEVTDEVLEEVTAWRNRPLEEVYPIVYFDALVAPVRDGGRVVKKSVYLALGLNMEGNKEVLGMWLGESEGAKFWLRVLTELKNRGMKDMLIACVDGLKGFPEAIEAEYPEAEVQLCIVHMTRNSLRYVAWKERKEVAGDLKTVYQAATEEEALEALKVFEEKWDERYPLIAQSWRRNWDNLRLFYGYPPEIRRVIYTTNAIESLNHSLRKVLKNRKALPNDEALFKVLYLGLMKASQRWSRPVKNWKAALNRFAIEYPGRLPL